jgi:AraC-like DNA-binding protein
VPASATVDQDLQRRMLSNIQDHYDQRLTLAALALTLRRRSTYLGRLFRKEVGMTVHEYVTRARMVFGAAHVCSGVKIEAVALNLGYRSKKNFYRQFKRFFGMTPEAYRHDHRQAGAIIPTRAEKHTGPPRPAGIAGSSTLSRHARGLSAQRIEERTTSPAMTARPTVAWTLSGSPLALLMTDENSRYVGATTTAVALTGYSVNELRGMRAQVLFPHAPSSHTKCRLQVLRPALSSLPATTLLQTRDAGRIPVHLMSVENLLGALGSVRSPDSRDRSTDLAAHVSVRGRPHKR